ncbi:hypothetical protein L0F63_000519 [Massospora cicadina]|nr:hypothetical protein L0F63_000519 [Massospora cicadina]
MSGKGHYDAIVEIDDDLIPETPQLEFQDFPLEAQPPSTQASAQRAGSVSPTGPPAAAFNPNAQPPTQSNWYSIAYYAQYFDVDTAEVVGRLRRALLYTQEEERFIDVVSDKPDLYVPFWGSLSVACAIFASSSLPKALALGYLSSEYDFNQIWTSMAVVYFYIFLTPLLLFLVAHYLGARPHLVNFVAVYGYSTVLWIPIVLLCVAPSEWIRWPLVILGAGYSGYFLAWNVYPTLKRADSSAVRSGLVLAVMAAHLLFAVGLKLEFLSYTTLDSHANVYGDFFPPCIPLNPLG